MIDLEFPDGSHRQYPEGATGLEVARSIAPSLAKRAALVKLDGRLRDLQRPLESGRIEIVTRDQPEALDTIRHDAAHVLAEAVQELFPGTQVTIGPAIEDGFYYDFAREAPFSIDDFPRIEAKMREIVDRDAPIVREVWDRDEAIRHFEAAGERFKAELIRDLPEGEEITVYKQGEWADLCRGPHFPSTRHVGKAFKLTKLAGAYWRGDHRNPQLQRMYGTAWATEAELEAYLKRLEEAEKRDHRKLGRQLDLFHMQEEGRGMVFWHPKGWTLWLALEAYVRRRLAEAGYVEVKTPQVLDRAFWEKSGHWEKYRPNMFVCETVEGEELSLKPMNCPGHVQVFGQGQRSYRELPIRMAEFGACHRYEPSGALHGLMRVRGFTQDDAHIFCREDQIVEETRRFVELTRSIHEDLGMATAYITLATRPEVRAGSDEFWDKAEGMLGEAARLAGVEPVIAEGDGAFYAPKLDFVVKDAIGREWTCGTLQLDYVLPDRLGAEYVAEDGSKQRPAMLHRAILGSFERFIGILIENCAGAFPLWLAPVQAVVATITSDADDYAREAAERLRAAGLRVETDLRNEKINYKVREHSLQKVPVIAVVGRREAEEGKVALRRFGSPAQEVVTLEEAVRVLGEEALPPDVKGGGHEAPFPLEGGRAGDGGGGLSARTVAEPSHRPWGPRRAQEARNLRSNPRSDAAPSFGDARHLAAAPPPPPSLPFPPPGGRVMSDRPKGWFSRLSEGLTRSSKQMTEQVVSVLTKVKLDQAALDTLEEQLIEADIGPEAAARITERFAEHRFGTSESAERIKGALADAIAIELKGREGRFDPLSGPRPFVVLFVGVNGSGKTTTLGKVAAELKGRGARVLVAAGDTFRAAAIEQLRIWGARAGVPVVAKATGADSAALAYEALERARAEDFDVLLIDTAGRLQNKAALMDELHKMVRVLKKLDPAAPHETLLVLDATVGRNALSQVEAFDRAAGVTGLVMTKLDGTARGGVLVPVAQAASAPVKLIGVGEQIADLQPFDARAFARGLLGLEAA